MADWPICCANAREGISATQPAMSMNVIALRAVRCQAFALQRIARNLAVARFPQRWAVFFIGIVSMAFTGEPGRAVPARKNRHDRQD